MALRVCYACVIVSLGLDIIFSKYWKLSLMHVDWESKSRSRDVKHQTVHPLLPVQSPKQWCRCNSRTTCWCSGSGQSAQDSVWTWVDSLYSVCEQGDVKDKQGAFSYRQWCKWFQWGNHTSESERALFPSSVLSHCFGDMVLVTWGKGKWHEPECFW